MVTMTAELQSNLTPDQALQRTLDGNKPFVEATSTKVTPELVDRAVEAQVSLGVEQVRRGGEILPNLEQRGDIRSVGGVYHVATGQARLLPS